MSGWYSSFSTPLILVVLCSADEVSLSYSVPLCTFILAPFSDSRTRCVRACMFEFDTKNVHTYGGLGFALFSSLGSGT
jgi:hypothetical protein